MFYTGGHLGVIDQERDRSIITFDWKSRGKEWEVLTLVDLTLLLDVPTVECRTLLILHGRALVEVLGEMGLVQASGLHHLPLGKVVLLHVALDHFGHSPGVLS